jgi:polysaccharide biosynthesis/export protein
MFRSSFTTAFAIATVLTAAAPAGAQTAAPAPAQPKTTAPQPAAPTATPTAPAPTTAAPVARPAAPPTDIATGIKPPADYVIGVEDALDVIYWQDKDMSASVVVRPDGNISLPLLNDIKAAGLTPEELRVRVAQAATKFVEDPTVSVVIKAINSRRVYISGGIAKPGPYPLMDAMTVLQLISVAGGPTEYAKTEDIMILRKENGKEVPRRFNYKDVSRGKKLDQNIQLKPGDTIIIPQG